jgi:hypothetical protein
MNVLPARLNDAELAGKVEQLEKAAKQLQGETDRAAKADKSIDKAARESLKTSIQQIGDKAKDVRSRIKEDGPASVGVGQLFSQAGKVRGTLAELSLPTAPWQGMQPGIEALARAYDLPKP